MPLELLNPTTFQRVVPSGDVVEIGDKDLVDFKPHLKLNRWGGECFIKVGLPVTEKSLPIIDGDKITWEGRDRHILMYPLTPDKQMELGGYEYEIVFEKKPLSNKIILDIQSQGLKFFYQPTLTQQEIEEGCFRPENVVGGYAVYHATKGGLVTKRDAARGITTGQGFFIFRPKIIDTRGDWVWGEQYIDPITGKQIITIPQEFLEYAHYPIRHVAGDTFGYTTKGGSSTPRRGRIGLTRGAPSGGDGTGDSISAWLLVAEGDAGRDSKCALYDDGDDEDDVTTNLVTDGITEEILVDDGAWDTLVTYDFLSPPSVTNGVYYRAAVWGDDLDRLSNLGSFSVRYNSVGGEHYYYQIIAYNGFPNPNSLSHSEGNIQSIYCTYTPAGGAVVEGSAAGSGIGIGASQAKLDVLASALGNGIGSSQSSAYLEVLAQAVGQGIGLATAQAILDILAEAGGSGVGLGTTEALIEVLAAAAASGEGLGEAEALLEVIAEAAGEGIGSGQSQSYIIVIDTGQGSGIGLGSAVGEIAAIIVLGEALGSGVGIASVEALVEVLAEAIGHGIGDGNTTRVFRVIPHIAKPPAIHDLGRIKSIPYNLGTMQDRYTLGRKRR